MKKQKNYTSLTILINKFGAWRELEEDGFVWSQDHFLVLNTRDFQRTAEASLHDKWFAKNPNLKTSNYRTALNAVISSLRSPIQDVNVVGTRSSAKLLHVILDELERHLTGEVGFTICGFDIDPQCFDRLTTSRWSASFHNCRLLSGWWWPTKADKVVESISFYTCVGAWPKNLRFGQASWPKLRSICIYEGYDASRLRPNKALYRRPEPINLAKSSALTPHLIRAFWCENLDSVMLFNCAEPSWLADFPSPPKVKDLNFSNTPVGESVFEWICRQKSVEDLGFAWEPGSAPNWSLVKNLKRLDYLDLSSTHLTDQDLADIARYCCPRTIHAYYTSITAASWKTVLPWKRLRMFWASQEAMTGEFPSEYPETTYLKEVVALNAHTEQYIAFLARYPGIQVSQM